MTNIAFAGAAAFVGNPPHDRPYADVRLNPAHPSSPTYKCLVDTGADYLQLPASAAAASGLSLSHAIAHRVRTAGGLVVLQRLNQVDVEIEGHTVQVDLLFDTTNTAPPLAGRGVLLAAFAIGFQPQLWLWT